MPHPSPRRPPASTAATQAVKVAFREAPTAASRPGGVPAALRTRRRKSAETRLRDALQVRTNGHVPAELTERLGRLVAAWAARGFDDGFEEAARFEQDCYEAAELAAAEQAGDDGRRFEAMETRHRANVVDEHGKIEIRGLQMSARVFQALDVAYVPLRLRDDSSEGEVIRGEGGIEIRAVPRVSVDDLADEHRRVVVVGAPGSGKSTIVAYLAAQTAAEKLGGKRRPVPFVVPVRSLGGAVLDEAVIARAARDLDAAFVRHVLDEGRALVLIDGLDEAQVGAERLIPVLTAFVKAHPANRFVVTSRPAGALGSERVEIPGFVSTTLLPMERDDVYTFIDRWCLAAELSIQREEARAREDAKRAADDLKGRVQTNRPVEKLAQTPLMCSALCLVHRFMGQRIPERRVALYEVCTNVLLHEWDQAKFPAEAMIGKLDAQQKKHLLSGLAFWMHEKRVAEAPSTEVVRIFGERLPDVGAKAGSAAGIVREIQERSGLLMERRPGFYGFSHLAFQEYLTAIEIVRVGALKELVKKCRDPWWHEVTILAAGLPGADAANIVRGLLAADTKNKVVSAATLLAAQCAETAIQLPASLRQKVEQAVARLVPPQTDDDVKWLIGVGAVAAPVLLKSLDGAAPAKRARVAVVLGRINYEPACGALVRLLDDASPVGDRIAIVVGASLRAGFTHQVPVSTFAAMALFHMSISSALARSAFEETMFQVSLETGWLLADIYEYATGSSVGRQQLGADAFAYLGWVISQLKAAPPAKRSPKRAARSG